MEDSEANIMPPVDATAVEAMRKRRETRKFVFTKSMLRRINEQLQAEGDDEDEDEDDDKDEDEKDDEASELSSEPSEPFPQAAPQTRKLSSQVIDGEKCHLMSQDCSHLSLQSLLPGNLERDEAN